MYTGRTHGDHVITPLTLSSLLWGKSNTFNPFLTQVGQKLRRAVAGSGKKISVEVGGKSPFVVFDLADLDSAVEGVVDAIFFNQGQVRREERRRERHLPLSLSLPPSLHLTLSLSLSFSPSLSHSPTHSLPPSLPPSLTYSLSHSY